MIPKLASALLESLTLEEIRELERLKSATVEKSLKPMSEKELYKQNFIQCQKAKMYKVA